MILPRPEDDSKGYYTRPLEDRPDLQTEYDEATQNLVNRLKRKGYVPIIMLAYGSLTRDKEIKMQLGTDKLQSDADFLVVIDKGLNLGSIKTLFTGIAEVGRFEHGDILGEKPFSEHIPNFDVKLMTIQQITKELQRIIDILAEYEFPSDLDDLIESERSLNTMKAIPETLVYGIPVYTDEKKQDALLPLQEKTAEVLEMFERHKEQYQRRKALLEQKTPRSRY